MQEIGYCALTLSILKNWTPERSWAYLTAPGIHPRKTLTERDIEDMIVFKETMTYGQVGKLYSLSKDAVYSRIRNYRKRAQGM